MIKYSKPLEQINNGKGKEQTLLINAPKLIEYEETHTERGITQILWTGHNCRIY